MWKRLEDHHVGCAEALNKKASTDVPDVIQTMMVLHQAKNRVKSRRSVKSAQDHVKVANKDTLEVEKEKVRKEVEEVQRVLEAMRTRTHPATVDDD